MGSCNSCTPSEYLQSNLESDERSQKIQRTKSNQNKGTNTYEKSKTDFDENNIADENSLENSRQLPPFVQIKDISDLTIQQRSNRFTRDIEEEVKFRIKQIYEEEKLLQQQMHNSSILEQQDSAEFKSAHFNQSISFQNSQDFQNLQNIPSKTYLPRQYSQFAPKKDTDTVTYNSQISQTINSQKLKTPTRDKNRMVQTVKDDNKSNTPSIASIRNNPRTDSQEAQFSDHFREQISSSASKEHSVKSILKTSQHVSSLQRGITIKSTHTNIQKKKVQFTGDTNYYSSRTTKRNHTNFMKN